MTVAGRPRALAVALTLMFLAPLVLMLVPTAEAAISAAHESKISVAGVESNNTAIKTIKIGDKFKVHAFANISFTPPADCPAAAAITWTVTADLRNFGSGFTATESVATGDDTTVNAAKEFTVTDAGTFAKDGSGGTYVNTTLSASCSGVNAQSLVKQTNGYVILDNVRPTGTADVVCDQNPCRIGSKVTITFPTVNGAVSATGDLTAIGVPTNPQKLLLGVPNEFIVNQSPALVGNTVTLPLTLYDGIEGTGNPSTNVGVTVPALSVDPHYPALANGNLTLTAEAGADVLVRVDDAHELDIPTNGSGFAVRVRGPTGSGIDKTLWTNASGANALEFVSHVDSNWTFRIQNTSDNLSVPPPGAGGLQHFIDVKLTDNAGNVGNTITGSVFPAAAPASIDLNSKPQFLRFNPTLSGTWSSGSPLVASAIPLNFSLQHANGSYWTGVAADPWTSPTAPESIALIPLTWTPITPTSGTFTLALTNDTADEIPDSRYTLRVLITSDGSTVADSFTFTRDRVAPTQQGTTSKVTSTTSGVLPQGSVVVVRLDLVDAGDFPSLPLIDASQPATLRLVNAVKKNPAIGLDGAEIPPTVCPSAACSVDVAYESASTHANLTWSLPAVLLGNYSVNVTFGDAAGNVISPALNLAPTQSPLLQIIPRYKVGFEPAFGNQAAGITLPLFAAFDDTTSVDPPASCPSNVCRITTIEVYGVNSTTSTPVPAFGTQGTLLYHSERPRDGPATLATLGPAHDPDYKSSDPLLYYDYSLDPGANIPHKGLNTSNMYTRVVVKAVNRTGATIVNATDWVKLKVESAPSALQTTRPVANTSVFMFGNVSSIKINATFEQAGAGAPALAYNVRMVRNASGPLATPVYVKWNQTSSGLFEYSPTPLSASVPATRTIGVLTYYNGTNAVAVPPGEYIINFTAFNASAPDVPLAQIERLIGVQDVGPVVAFPAQSEVFAGKFVTKLFNLTFSVTHGFANLSAARVNVSLLASNQNGPGQRTILPGSETFTATLRDLNLNVSNTTTWGNFTLKLPDNATDNTSYDVVVNVTTDSYDFGGFWSASTKNAFLIKVDAVPPAPGVYRQQSNDSAYFRGAEILPQGFAVDTGSGVGRVQVRIYDVNASKTYDPAFGNGVGGWIDGDVVERWLDSDTTLIGDNGYARNVQLATSIPTSTWTLPSLAATRPVLRLATLDAGTGTSFGPLGYGRTYDITFTNLALPSGVTSLSLFSGATLKSTAAPTLDALHGGKWNVTFVGVRLDVPSSTWELKNGATTLAFVSVSSTHFTVDDRVNHSEQMLKTNVLVNDVTEGFPLVGNTADVTLRAAGSAAETWYLYPPATNGSRFDFAATPIAVATLDVSGSALEGKFPGVDLHTWGVWRANKSDSLSVSSTFVVPRANYSDLGLDRNHTYRIDVRAKDRIGEFSLPREEVVAFDTYAPGVNVTLAGPTLLDWHGGANIASSAADRKNFTVSVSDNHCVRAVRLFGTTESGVSFGPINFTSPLGLDSTMTNIADCNAGIREWRLDLLATPAATDVVGDVEYAVEVEDSAGNVVRDPRTLNATVLDTQQALVRFLRLEPPVAQAGGIQRVVAEIFENHEIESVKVFLQRVDDRGVVTAPLGEALARPIPDQVGANGTGNWTAQTDLDFNITNLTEGDYLWTVRPRDANGEFTCDLGCHQKVILGKVSAEGAAFISLEQPVNGTTVIGSSPQFVWRVIDRTATASSITVEAGESTASLARVNATLTPLPTVGGQNVGYTVWYNATNVTTNLSLRVTVASTFLVSNTWNFTVDATPPTIVANVTGTQTLDNVTYAVSSTRVTLTADDNESSVAQITYTINDGATLTYANAIAPSGDEGPWRLEYLARDAAGNVARGNVSLLLDTRGPNISVARHGDDLLVTATDAGVGIDESNVSVHYAYGNATSYSIAKLTKGVGNSFGVLLPGNATATGLRYYFDAKDKLGNLGTRFSALQPHVIQPDQAVDNLPPTLAITKPLPAEKVRDSVTLEWIAADPEDDPISITIALRDPTGTGDFLLQGGDNNGSFIVDVSRKAEGAYTLVVTASDAEKNTQETVTFTVERPEVYDCTVCPTNGTADEPFTVSLAVNAGPKTVATVTYNVTRDGVVVATGQLHRTGDTWSASITPTEAGNYKVFVAAQYTDGSSEPVKQIASFAVQGKAAPAPGVSFPTSLIVLLVIGVLTVALAAYGAFVRWK